jgi:hypothetical protein
MTFLASLRSLLLLVIVGTLACTARAEPLPRLHTEGAKVVDASGNPVTLRGTNLGNWLLIEAWMLGWDIEDQETIIKVLADRFGAGEAERLMTMYRDGYITPRDFELIKSFGFNVVRVPFDSRMLIDADGQMRPDAFKYLDRALDMAEEAGVYVILDMHGAPGSQSNMDHTGKRDQNKLWSDPRLQDQMVELWRTISQRYKDRSVVAAYDVLNEPYGDFQTDMRPALRDLIPRCYEAIRSTGDTTIVIFPNALGAGISFYGDLKSRGFTQIAFTDHYYAGLFGSPTTLQSHAGVFDRVMPEAQAYLDLNDAAMLIGEFNVVLERGGGDALMRRYYDEFARRGWMATMWSHKLLKPAAGVQPDNWYLVTNKQPLPVIDVRTSSLAEIEAYFQQLATMPLVVDEALRTALTSPTPPTIHMPTLRPLPAAAPSSRTFDSWSLVDVNTATPAGLVPTDDGVAIVATGADVFGQNDSFAFLQRQAPRQAVLSATVDALQDSGQWAKAGLMVRFGQPGSPTYESAPFAMVNTFTDGTIAFLFREAHGATAQESKRFISPLPGRLAIARDGPRVDAYVQSAPGTWISVGSATIQSNAPAQIGLVTSSNSQTLFTQASFSGLSLASSRLPEGTVVGNAQPTIRSEGTNLIKDPAFTTIPTSQSSWHQWGNAITSREGADGLVLRPEAGLWQDIDVVAGKTYAFAIRVRRVPNTSAMNVTLSLEATVDGKQVAIADKSVSSAGIESNDGWSVLRINAVAAYPTMRVLIRTGSIDGANDAAIEIDESRVWQDD